jgi:uncharacterized protein YktA (UPF0223 family)
MRGKKVDSQFLTDFISSCIMKGNTTPDEMALAAQREIDFINSEIRKVEDLKLRRSKLLDVVVTFKEPVKANKEEARILTFFQIQNPHICKFLIDLIKINPLNREELICPFFSSHDVNFCVKQLLEHRVIAKVGETLLRGENFDEYLRFVLQEG